MDLTTLSPAWISALGPVLGSPPLGALDAFLRAEESAGRTIYPPPAQRLRALELTEPGAVRVVILGQDPYHGPGQAMGLAFSVSEGARVPPSLANIYKELERDLGLARPPSGDLSAWARQGVLLLNSVLTVQADRAGSHRGRGWEVLTDAVVSAVAAQPEPTVFMLWGAAAQAKAGLIKSSGGRHLVLTAPHPSPLSAHRGFIGCGHFGAANAFLKSAGRGAVDWNEFRLV